MGLLDGILGNAAEVEASTMQAEFSQVLAPGEQVEKAYVVIRDAMLFTNRRLILVDKQGITCSKVEYHSLPYRSITHLRLAAPSISAGGGRRRGVDLRVSLAESR